MTWITIPALPTSEINVPRRTGTNLSLFLNKGKLVVKVALQAAVDATDTASRNLATVVMRRNSWLQLSRFPDWLIGILLSLRDGGNFSLCVDGLQCLVTALCKSQIGLSLAVVANMCLGWELFASYKLFSHLSVGAGFYHGLQCPDGDDGTTYYNHMPKFPVSLTQFQITSSLVACILIEKLGTSCSFCSFW